MIDAVVAAIDAAEALVRNPAENAITPAQVGKLMLFIHSLQVENNRLTDMAKIEAHALMAERRDNYAALEAAGTVARQSYDDGYRAGVKSRDGEVAELHRRVESASDSAYSVGYRDGHSDGLSEGLYG